MVVGEGAGGGVGVGYGEGGGLNENVLPFSIWSAALEPKLWLLMKGCSSDRTSASARHGFTLQRAAWNKVQVTEGAPKDYALPLTKGGFVFRWLSSFPSRTSAAWIVRETGEKSNAKMCFPVIFFFPLLFWSDSEGTRIHEVNFFKVEVNVCSWNWRWKKWKRPLIFNIIVVVLLLIIVHGL